MKNKLPPALRRLCYGLGLMLMACLLVGAMFTMSLAAGGTANVTISGTPHTVTVLTDPTDAGSASVSTWTATGSLATVKLTASADTGWELDYWTVSGDEPGISVSLDNYKSYTPTLTMGHTSVTVTAHFKETEYGVTVKTTGNGSATANPQTANAGDPVTLTATPGQGSVFADWTVTAADGAAVTVAGDNTFIMPASDVTVTARFRQTAYGVTVNTTGRGEGSATADPANANAGETVTLTAIPDRGSVFAGWTVESGDVTDLSYLSRTTATFTMPSGGVTVNARFDAFDFGQDEEEDDGEDVINLDVYQVLTKRLRIMPMNLNPPGTLSLRLGKEQGGLWGNLYRCPARERLDVRDEYRSGNYEDLEFCSASLIEENGAAEWPLEYDAAYAYIVLIDTADHTPWTDPFTDVDEDDPFYEAVQYVCENGVMPGVTETAFEPEAIVTRAQLLTILWQLEGSPAVEGEPDFDDVEEDAWYGDAVRWAASTGLASGDGNGLFGAEDPLTREQLAVILFRYAVQFDGLAAVTLEENLTGFADADEIGPWAVAALNWAVGQGILAPESETALAPTAGVTRALLAQTLMNYLT